MFTDYDVVIIGSGCAGLAAAIFNYGKGNHGWRNDEPPAD